MPVVVNKTEEILADMCEILFSVAQRHVSNNDHKTIAELAHVALSHAVWSDEHVRS
jgi:predicted site-specific integrase-resolvase